MLTKPRKPEIIFIATTLLILTSLIVVNLQSAQVKARDNQRKNDLKRMQGAIDNYITTMGKFPVAQDGQILSCGDPENLKPCAWGKDDLTSIDESGNRHIFQNVIPQDPLWDKDYSYVYFSDGDQYQILAHLESSDDPEFMPQVKARGVKCGQEACNYGVANSGTALDKSVEQQPKPKDLP